MPTDFVRLLQECASICFIIRRPGACYHRSQMRLRKPFDSICPDIPVVKHYSIPSYTMVDNNLQNTRLLAFYLLTPGCTRFPENANAKTWC